MIKWHEVETVLLDMDGTLLDLHFDNYFWQIQLPQKWGELNGMDMETAKTKLLPIYQSTEATLSWYCLDYWSEKLKMDVFEIKNGIEHLVQLRPHVEEFLTYIKKLGKNVVLVTNSHEKFIAMKMEITSLNLHLDDMYNAHSFGAAKEEVAFWEILGSHISYTGESTVLIDDNLSVLRTAREHGIQHLLSIAQPSSQAPVRNTAEFRAISSFRDLCY